MNLPDMKEAKSRHNDIVDFIYKDPIQSDVFNGKKCFIKTYGCQMNVHDSEEIAGILENLGFEQTEDYEQADLIILNTCAIRENAHDKVFGFLGRCKHLKKTNPELKLCLCGCMAQEKSVVDEIMTNHKYIDLVFGTHNIHELPNLLMNLHEGLNIEVKSNEGDVIEVGEVYKRDSHYTAWINIMYGCDKFCTYCIVPYTRGKERSRKSTDILKEVNCLKEQGYKEITLLGQNVNAYGKDFTDIKYSFANLLEDLAKTNIHRIRYTTSHPRDLDIETMEVMGKYDNIMPHLHLPVQSGSNDVLKKMNRKYTKEVYLEKVNKLKECVPGISLTTDIIVAFPNETEEDFNETLDLVRKADFEGAYTFIFSPRTGTPAASMDGQIDPDTAKRRLLTLNELINEGFAKGNKRFEGTVQEVLVEGYSGKKDHLLTGYTKHNKLVNFEGDESLIGTLVNVKIKKAFTWHLLGEIEK